MNIEEYIQSFTSGSELEQIKAMIDDQIMKIYNLKENFYLHDKTDDYIYRIVYADGHIYYDCIGKRAYEKFTLDSDAVRIERKTKDLFPTVELLLEKAI